MSGFAIWIGIGASLGMWRVARSTAEKQTAAWLNVSLIVLAAALIGARLFYAWENLPYFTTQPGEVLRLSEGGLSWPGAVIGAWLAVLLLAARLRTQRGGRVSPGWVADRLYPLLAPITVTAWLGCWQIGCAYGPVAPEGAWWAISTLDEYGVLSRRLPLQPAAALVMLLFFFVLEARVKPGSPAGRLSVLAAVGLLLHLFAASWLRADPAPLWNNLRIETWAALILLAFLLLSCLVGAVILLVQRRQPLSQP